MSKDKQTEEMWNIITTDCDEECVGCEFENDDWCFTHRAINNLYNAGYRKQSEGEWVYEYTGDCLEGTDASLDYKCTLCDQRATDPWNFCPNCGAKMKGGE